MLTVLIGHRGVGKSSLCAKLQSLLNESTTWDLDALIQNDTARSIPELFINSEEDFREQELKSFKKHCLPLANGHGSHIVSVGAGFPNEYLSELKVQNPNIRVVWIRRRSDEHARFEGDRPPLSQSILQTWELRKSAYEKCCDEVLFLPEGPFWPESYCEFLKAFFKQKVSIHSYIQTLPQGDTQSLLSKVSAIIQRGFGVEFRNDLHSNEVVFSVLKQLCELEAPVSRDVLLSLRKIPDSSLWESLEDFSTSSLSPYRLVLDVDILIWQACKAQLESLPLSKELEFVLSLHSEGPAEDQLAQSQEAMSLIEQFPERWTQFKWAPSMDNINSLEALWRKFQSFEAGSIQTSFLPRGPKGFGKFFRCLRSHENRLNFTHSFLTDDPSQPTLWEIWTQQSRSSENSAKLGWRAVLGADTRLSWSPLFHHEWSQKRREAFFNLSLNKAPRPSEIDFLVAQGMKGLAVTSPYKSWAAEGSDSSFANTLKFDPVAETDTQNTDIIALKNLLSGEMKKKSILIYGQGAIGKQLAELLSGALCLGQRELETQQSKKNYDEKGEFDLLIWAASPSASYDNLPQKIGQVWDMNYFEHSQAQAYAQSLGAKYTSGRTFFENQGLLQQDFWTRED